VISFDAGVPALMGTIPIGVCSRGTLRDIPQPRGIPGGVCHTAPHRALQVAAIAGSRVGGRVAGAVDPRRLTIAFAVLLVVVALYTAARSQGVIG